MMCSRLNVALNQHTRLPARAHYRRLSYFRFDVSLFHCLFYHVPSCVRILLYTFFKLYLFIYLIILFAPRRPKRK